MSISPIQEKIRAIHQRLINKMGKRSQSTETFIASWGWFRRFKERANLPNSTVTDEAANSKVKAANEYSFILKKAITSRDKFLTRAKPADFGRRCKRVFTFR